MDRSTGLLLGGATLVTGAFRQLEDDAVGMTRAQTSLNVRRHVGRSRRLVNDILALVQLVIGVIVLVQGLRASLREWAGVDAVDAVDGAEVVSDRTDTEPVA